MKISLIIISLLTHNIDQIQQQESDEKNNEIVIVEDNTEAIPEINEDIVSFPMTVDMWRDLSVNGKKAYVKVVLSGLKWSPEYAACKDLTIEAITKDIDWYANNDTGNMLNAIAVSLNQNCTR